MLLCTYTIVHYFGPQPLIFVHVYYCTLFGAGRIRSNCLSLLWRGLSDVKWQGAIWMGRIQEANNYRCTRKYHHQPSIASRWFTDSVTMYNPTALQPYGLAPLLYSCTVYICMYVDGRQTAPVRGDWQMDPDERNVETECCIIISTEWYVVLITSVYSRTVSNAPQLEGTCVYLDSYYR